MKTILLHTDEIAVEVRPDEGGRVSSLRCLERGTEFLTASHRRGPSAPAGLDAQFRNGPCAGVEDCLPTVAACGAHTAGGPVPDHGDLWQLPWNLLEPTGSVSLHMEAHCFSRPLSIRKHMRVSGRVLRIDYQIRNTGPQPTSLLFALHPLLAIAAGDRIVLPDDLRTLALTHKRGYQMQHAGDTVTWPATLVNGEWLDLSRTGAATDGLAAMLYTPPLRHGTCGLYRSQQEQGILLRFDPARLPCLGIWLSYGGWPDTPDAGASDTSGAPDAIGAPDTTLQYAVALEPTTAPFGSLDDAQRAEAAVPLQPGQHTGWSVEFEITTPGQSYAAFLQQVQRIAAP